MNTLPRLLLAISLVVLLVLPVTAFTTTAQVAAEKGPAADRVEWFRVNLPDVEAFITGGKLDVYVFGVPGDTAVRLAATPGIKIVTAPSGLTDMILNPAPVQIAKFPGRLDKDTIALKLGVNPILIRYTKYLPDEGKTLVEFCGVVDLPVNAEEVFKSDRITFNPFCIRDIRFELNYVFDREKLLREVYRGFATIKYTFYGPDDPTYTELADAIAKYAFTYDFERARRRITDIMTAAGAELREGKWTYKGNRIDITGIIRVEDERLLLGRAFALELVKLGFNVIPAELTFGKAITIVYGGNPIDFEWHFYTEGWGKGALDRWDPGNLAQFGADIIGFLPGWAEPTYWNYKHELMRDGRNASDYADLAYYMNVKSKEEWVDALRKGTELAILESIRIWGFATHTKYPVRADVKGLTIDLGAGLRSPFNCRGWYVEGRTDIKVGHLWVFTARTSWNTFMGFSDVYSVDPARCTYDFVIWRHPFTGMPIPFRATFTVETAGPDGKLGVPNDAIWFDADKNVWVYASELGRTKATSKVVFDMSRFLGAKWHNGQTITWADLLGSLALYLDGVYDPVKSDIEGDFAAIYMSMYDTVVAIRPVGNNLEVYIDYWHFEPAYIGDWGTWATATSLPFELVAAQDFVSYVTKERALSDTRAKAENIPWLSLVIRGDAELIATHFSGGNIRFDDYKGYMTMPDGKVLMTADEWSSRVKALLTWFSGTGNVWISNGPYKLTYYDTKEQKLVLEAFRDPTYPFGPKDWVYGEAQPVAIAEVRAPLIPVGRDAKIVVIAKGAGEITVKYLMVDPETKEVVFSGLATRVKPDTFELSLSGDATSLLKPYAVYNLMLIAYSTEVALPAEVIARVQTAPAELIERLAGLEEGLKTLEGSLDQTREELSKSIEDVKKGLSEEMAKSLTALSDAISTAIEGLGKATTEAIRALGTETASQITEVRTSSEAKISEVETRLSEEIATVADTSQAAQSNARLALIVSVINLLVLLGIGALIYTRR